MFIVYVIYSRSLKRYYTGQTNDVIDRVLRHNSGHEKFSKTGILWDLVWIKETETRSEAVKLEIQVKKQGAKRYLERKFARGVA